MEQLTLEHLIPYLNHNVRMWKEGWARQPILHNTCNSSSHININTALNKIIKPKLVLYPLSGYKKGDCKDNDIDFELRLFKGDNIRPEDLSHKSYIWLIKNHYDYFGLIPKGLAIDKNTLK